MAAGARAPRVVVVVVLLLLLLLLFPPSSSSLLFRLHGLTNERPSPIWQGANFETAQDVEDAIAVQAEQQQCHPQAAADQDSVC